MARGRDYSNETKAAVMAALLAGQSVSSTAKQYNIPKGTVSSWKDQAANMRRVESDSTQKKDLNRIGDSLIDLVTTEIESLIEISKITRDPRWVKAQTAADLAVFAGVKHDKLMRMLESFGQSNDTDSNAQN